jgi:hypothetical protein
MFNAKRRSRILVIGGSLAICLIYLSLAFLSTAQAAVGEYDVEVCTPQGNARNHGLEVLEEGAEPGHPAVNLLTDPCEPGSGEAAIVTTAFENLVVGFSEWSVNAAEGTLIRSLQGNRTVTGNGKNISRNIQWVAFPADPMAPEFEHFSLFNPPSGPFSWTPADPGTSSVHGKVFCGVPTGCNNQEGEAKVAFTDVIAHVVDRNLPTVTTAGPLLAGGPVSGTKELSFRASDAGSGVAKVSLLVDGSTKESKTDSNGGLCAKPYQAMAPCATEFGSSFNLDTTALSEGLHRVEVVVEDASGQTAGAPATVDVHNRPLNTGRPSISGTAKLGQPLAADTGQWAGGPTSFAYQWLRCPASATVGNGDACAAAGANSEIYDAAGADVGKRLVVKVTAANAFGSEAAFSAPTVTIAALAGPDESKNPPQTKISKHPRKKSALKKAKFSFSSDQPHSSFECQFDKKGAFKACRSPFKRKVKPGRHSFQVRAINASGIADPSPAVFRWTVS